MTTPSYPAHFQSLEAFLQHCQERSQLAQDMYGPEAPISDGLKMWADRYNHDVSCLIAEIRSFHSKTSDEFGFDIKDLPRFIADFSAKVLSDTNEAGLAADAEQYFQLAMDTLNQAKRYAELAAIAQSRALAGR